MNGNGNRSTSSFYPANPDIFLDGQQHAGLSTGLLTLYVQETVDGLYRCEASFGNWGANSRGEVGTLYDDRQVLDFGKPLAVRIGDGDAEAQIFDGRIMALEGHFPQTRPPEMLVLAEDRFQDLRMTRRTRTFEEMTDADVLQAIAGEYGLQPDIRLDGPSHRALAQVNQSDLAFVRDRAREAGAELWVEGRTLYVRSRAQRDGPRLTLTHGQGLMEFSALADLAHQRSALTVSGWDPETKDVVEFEAGDAALSGELNGGSSGATTLQQAIGARAERVVHHAFFTQQEAQQLAEAHYRRIARRFVTGTGSAQGDGRIRAGTVIEITGVGDLFSGDYYVTEALHLFDRANGYRTRFQVERAGL